MNEPGKRSTAAKGEQNHECFGRALLFVGLDSAIDSYLNMQALGHSDDSASRQPSDKVQIQQTNELVHDLKHGQTQRQPQNKSPSKVEMMHEDFLWSTLDTKLGTPLATARESKGFSLTAEAFSKSPGGYASGGHTRQETNADDPSVDILSSDLLSTGLDLRAHVENQQNQGMPLSTRQLFKRNHSPATSKNGSERARSACSAPPVISSMFSPLGGQRSVVSQSSWGSNMSQSIGSHSRGGTPTGRDRNDQLKKEIEDARRDNNKIRALLKDQIYRMHEPDCEESASRERQSRPRRRRGPSSEGGGGSRRGPRRHGSRSGHSGYDERGGASFTERESRSERSSRRQR